MLFNSIEFLIFFPIVVVLYFLLPHRYRWLLLLAASYYFYMSWRPEYIVLILASTLVDYFVALSLFSTLYDN
jgi:D-alanyl-lipoteichoic acid acyltransferase DltB (MBOAT superfamily)